MGTILDLIVIDEKKIKRVNIAKSLLFPIFGITLILKNQNLQEYSMLVLTIIFALVFVVIIVIFSTKTYKITGQITVLHDSISIEKNSKIEQFKYEEVKKVELNFFTEKIGLKLHNLAQIGKNEIKITNKENKEFLFHFLMKFDRTGKILSDLSKDMKYNNVKIENIYGTR